MQPPLNESDTLFEKLLQDLPADLEDSARAFKAFTRRRKLQTPQDVLRVVLLDSGVDQSLREVAGTMTLQLGESLTDTAIQARLVAAQPWVKVLLQQMLAMPAELGSQLGGRRLVVVDASHVTGPEATGTEYRIHVKLDLVSCDFLEVRVTDAKTSESLLNFHYQAGDVVVGDRAYIRCQRVLELGREQVEVIGRFSPTQCVVRAAAGQEIEWPEELGGMERGAQKTLTVRLCAGAGENAQAWIHIYRKSEQDSSSARRKCRRKAQQDGRQAKALTLLLCEYVLVLSTIGPAELSGAVVLQLYRVRWQVELAFKRWKSLLAVSQQRCRRMSELGWVWMYGKLLYAVLIERRAARRMGFEKLQPLREQSLWRIWKLVAEEVAPLITGSLSWQESRWQQAITVLGERRRKRRLQTVPAEVLVYLQKGLERQPQISGGSF